MKKIILSIAISLVFSSMFAQDIIISFATTCAGNTVDNVLVENLTKGTNITLNGSDILVLTITSSTGIEDMKSDNTIQVIPNPITNEGEIRFHAPVSGIVNITICDAIGRKVAQQSDNLQVGSNTYTLNGLPSGVYYIRIIGQGYTYNTTISSIGTASQLVTLKSTNASTEQQTSNKLKSFKSLVTLAYTLGDNLRFTATSGTIVAIVSDSPASTKTESFTFISAPVIATSSISAITSTTATSGGTISNDGCADITAQGICWNTIVNPTTANSKTTESTSAETFTSSITDLTPVTTYYARAYATNSAGTAYGTQQSFTTLAVLPTITTSSISAITDSTATCGGTISNDGRSTVTARGVCWSTNQNPTIEDSITTNGTGSGSFTSSITGLTPGTTYYVRAYTTNSAGTAYGTQQSFTTLAVLPTITTSPISAITSSTATIYGTITNDGGATITTRGVCWSTTANPTTANIKTTNGTGIGIFTSSITGLTPATTYYVRAYATNNVGTSYGLQQSFTTIAVLPTITTSSISAITSSTAISGGTILNNGGATITARGICYSTSQDPTTTNSKIADGTSTGTFTSNITGLTSGTTYYVRAYATNSVGTAYGTQQSFITLAVPIISTSSISALTDSSATCGGTISSDGGATITARGVCWSTTANPTTANRKTIDGTGSGTFISSIRSLTPFTTYYVRAYATNNVGTGYGTQQSFTTTSIIMVNDRDGNSYSTVIIGTQTWMAANLNTTTYNDGTPIPNVTNPNIWDTLSSGALCTYNNTSNADTINTFGRLYNWYAVNTNKLCPTGWHVPNSNEWFTLESYLNANGYNYDGSINNLDYNIAKSMASITGWKSSISTGAIGNNPSTNNTSGFTALPSGYRYSNGASYDIGYFGFWWSSDRFSKYLSADGSNLNPGSIDKVSGYSVRCLKD